MTFSIPIRKRKELRDVLERRFTRAEVTEAIADLELDDPQYPREMDDAEWRFNVVEHLERARHLPKLAEGLAQRLDKLNAGDDDATTLREIAKKETKKTITAPAEGKTAEGTQNQPNTDENGGGPQRLAGIVVLGEPIAVSDKDTVVAREDLVKKLAEIFDAEDIPVTDWGDGWDTKRAVKAKQNDISSLFVRVVNNDTLTGDIESLNALPARIGRKLGKKGPITLSQVMIWICGSATSEQTRPNTSLALRFGPADGFAVNLKSKFGFEKSPPVISLENPGENHALEEKLISFVSARTASICRPPDPLLVYLEAMSGETATDSELRQLLNTEVSRGGVILAIHDLNLEMTDSPGTALLQFKDRLTKYDNLLAPILREQGFPNKKILKIAIVMNLREALPLGQFPFKRMIKDWIVIGMKTVEDAAVLIRAPDERIIAKGIDGLLGQS